MEETAVATVILAGGQGTRLFPLTMHHCKPAIAFGGRYRLIDIPISNAIHSGYRRIFVIAQYLSAELTHHISQTYQFGIFQTGSIDVITPEENEKGEMIWYTGTADAVRKTLPILLREPVDWILILSGDQLYNIDFQQMLAFAEKQDADLTIATTPVSVEETSRFGILDVDKDNYIRAFVEKPAHLEQISSFARGKSYLASMGIYVFKRQALVALLKSDPGEDFGKHLIPNAIKHYKSSAFVYDGYWEDIGTVSSYYLSNLLLTTDKKGLDAYDERRPIYTRQSFLPGPKVISSHIVQSILCEGSLIEASEISQSIVGIRSKIGRNTTLRNSILIGNHYSLSFLQDKSRPLPLKVGIGEKCLIEKAIIDEHVCIGDGARLTNEKKLTHFDGDGVFIRDGIIIVTAGTTLPPRFVL